MIVSDEVRRHLHADETVVWMGHPHTGLALAPHDIVWIPVNMLTTAVLIWFYATGEIDRLPVIFALIGLALFQCRFLVDAGCRKLTTYVLTDKRILVVKSWPFGKTIARERSRFPLPKLKEGRHGRGTIYFNGPPTIGDTLFDFAPYNRAAGAGLFIPSMLDRTVFVGIENARTVMAHLKRA